MAETTATIARYESYKDSDVEWLGEIPEHWETTKIKFFFKNKNSIFIDGDWIESKDIGSDEVYYFTTGNIRELKFYDKERTFISNQTFDKLNCTEIYENDILISRLNLPIGRCCLAPKFDKKTIVSVDVCVLRADRDYDRSFLVYVMNSPQYFSHTENEARGAIMKRISRTILGNISLPIPPLQEQTKIAQFLDDKTTKIDEAIAIKEQQIQLLKERKQILIHKAVTQGLDPNVTLKDSGVEWIGEIPEHWEVKKLKYFVNIQGGFAFNSGDFVDEGIQIIKIANTYMNRLSLDRQPTFVNKSYLTSHKDWVVSKNDILMSLTGTLGKKDYGFAILIEDDEKYLLNQRVAKITVKNGFEPEYLVHLLRSDSYLNQLYCLPAGTKQANLSNDNVINIKMPIPPVSERKEISVYIETASQKIETAINLKQHEIEKLKEYKRSLINGVVTGKVRVC